MFKQTSFYIGSAFADIKSGMVVFLVAIPLCLGISLACGSPIQSGIISGIAGGIVVGLFSKSHVSVSGPSAGFIMIVSDAIISLGDYRIFLVTVVLAGLLQIVFGVVKFGTLSNYIPSSVVNGLLFAIGILLILKQIPQLLGYNGAGTGDFAFLQFNHENTFSAIIKSINVVDIGSGFIGFSSLFILFIFDKLIKRNKKFSIIPPALIVVLFGAVVAVIFEKFLHTTTVPLTKDQYVALPTMASQGGFFSSNGLFIFPDARFILDPIVLKIALMLAAVLSLEALVSVTASIKIDRHKRPVNMNKELVAQGLGNVASGMFGGIPVTSVVVRSAVNESSGAQTKFSTIFHGILLFVALMFVPHLLNNIPLATLAAVLIFSGAKMASISKGREMYAKGLDYFVPFVATILLIIFTNVLIGIAVGLFCGIVALLRSNHNNPFKFIKEKCHLGEITRINLPQQISFLNKSSFIDLINQLPNKSNVIIDASNTDYIEPDVLDIIKEFSDSKKDDMQISLVGFKPSYNVDNRVKLVNSITKDMQQKLTPSEVLSILKDGNSRFVGGRMVNKNLLKQVAETANYQNPMAVVLSCIDSRAAPEIIFDLGLGDILSIRIAGNVVNEDIIGSIEFACKALGAKLILVLGHTGCGAIKAACDGIKFGHVTSIIEKIEKLIPLQSAAVHNSDVPKEDVVEHVTRLNVRYGKRHIPEKSTILAEMIGKNEVMIVGGVYDIATGVVDFMKNEAV